MVNTINYWNEMTEIAIIGKIGQFIKHERLKQNKTQSDIARASGLNRWTLVQIENGKPISLVSMIQILRALNLTHIFKAFEITNEISPIQYAKLKREQRQRARGKTMKEPKVNDIGW